MASEGNVVPLCRRGDGLDAARGASVRIRPRAGTGRLWRALTEVLDPEVPVSVVDLGLVCDIRREGGHVEVDVTFTSTACPAVNFIKEDIGDRLRQEPDVDSVQVNEAWTVAWTSERITDVGRRQMRRYGITL